jgi:hypothetical protein
LIIISSFCSVTESGRRQRDARSSAAVGVDVNPSKDLGAVVRDPRSLLDIIVLISRSAWSLLHGHRKLNTEAVRHGEGWCQGKSRFEMNYVIQLIS